MFSVLLLKVAREVWTKSRAVVSFRGRRVGQPMHRSSVDSIYHQRKTRVGWHSCSMPVSMFIWLRVWCQSFTLCFTLECCDSQSSANPLQHHITVSFYCLIGDKESIQIAQHSIWTFSILIILYPTIYQHFWELLCTFGVQSHRQHFGSDCAVGERCGVQHMTVCFQQVNF